MLSLTLQPGPIFLRLILHTTKKKTFSIKDFFSKCDQIQFSADLVTFTEKILNKKLYFLSSNSYWYAWK